MYMLVRDFYGPLLPQTGSEVLPRLAEAGGNVTTNVFLGGIAPSQEKTPFQYQIYSCQTQTFTPSPLLDAHRLIVVEGSYSHHPLLAADMT